jgi:hypothetical protein
MMHPERLSLQSSSIPMGNGPWMNWKEVSIAQGETFSLRLSAGISVSLDPLY